MNPTQLSGAASTRRSHASGALQRAVRHYGGIVVGLIVLCGFFWALSPNFMSVNNLVNVVMQVSIIAILGFGMTYVLLLGDIDLSVGATMALVGTVCAFALEHGASPLVAVLAAMVTGLVLGAVNGSLSALLTIPSFIVTVATMGVFRGLAYLAGGNREAALYSGIDVNRLRIMIFMISGLLASIGGVLMTSRLYSAQPNAGIGYELDAIAAAVLGGTSLSGGYGTITGTLIGALIIGVINNGMSLLSVPYFYQLIVKGIVILVAVCIDVQTKKRHV